MGYETVTAVSVLSGLCGMAVGIASAKRNAHRDTDKNSRETATIISEIGYVKSGIDDIKRRQERMDEKHYSLAARVCAVETYIQATKGGQNG